MSRKIERWIATADNHGNHAHEPTCSVLFDFIKHFKPTMRIHLGDGYNFAKLRKGATPQERQEALQPDVDAGNHFNERLKPNVYLCGNHCFRIFQLAKSTDEGDRALATKTIDSMHESIGNGRLIEYGKETGFFRYGDYTFTHGFASGDGASRLMANVFGNVIFGHNHFCDDQPVARFDHETGEHRARGICAGCTCHTSQDYNLGQLKTLRQENAFVYGFKVGNRLIPYSARAIEGRWFFPSEFREVIPA